MRPVIVAAKSAARATFAAAMLALLFSGAAPARAQDTAFFCYASTKGVAVNCTNAAQRIVGYSVGNENNSSPSFVQVFNLPAGSVVLGTTPPAFVIPMPTGLGRERSMPYKLSIGGPVSFACTTTETGSTAPTGNCDIRIDYQ